LGRTNAITQSHDKHINNTYEKDPSVVYDFYTVCNYTEEDYSGILELFKVPLVILGRESNEFKKYEIPRLIDLTTPFSRCLLDSIQVRSGSYKEQAFCKSSIINDIKCFRKNLYRDNGHDRL